MLQKLDLVLNHVYPCSPLDFYRKKQSELFVCLHDGWMDIIDIDAIYIANESISIYIFLVQPKSKWFVNNEKIYFFI